MHDDVIASINRRSAIAHAVKLLMLSAVAGGVVFEIGRIGFRVISTCKVW